MPLHYTKSGALDMRYSSSKAAVSAGYGSGSGGYGSVFEGYGSGSGTSSYLSGSSAYGSSYASPSYSTSSASSNLHYKKDGSLDMRFNSSKEAVASSSRSYGQFSTPYSSYSVAMPQSSDLHYKKDGYLDMRFNSSKEATASSSHSHGQSSTPYPSSTSVAIPQSSDLHYKKDGSLDMRFNSSKVAVAQPSTTPLSSGDLHFKKDGGLDMRYTSSKLAVGDVETKLKTMNLSGKNSGACSRQPGISGKQSMGNVYSIPTTVPLKKDGTPDMRNREAKRWVQQQAEFYASNNILPLWVPTKKDGTINSTNAIGRIFVQVQPINPGFVSASSSEKRKEYWNCRITEELFFELLRKERVEPHPMPPPAILLPAPVEFLSEISSRSWRQTSSSNTVSVPTNVNEIDYSSLKFDDKIIGKGAFGVVQKATWNGIEVAVKILHLTQLTRKERADFAKEICILAAVGEHTNLVYLHGYCSNPPCIVMELVERGSLNHLLHYCTDPEVEVVMTDGRVKRILMCGVAEGMHQLHAFKIIHGDLKPQNILVTSDYTAKITDFGLSTLRGKTSSSLRSKDIDDDDDGDEDCRGGVAGGTSGYMAPELLQSTSPPDYPVDVYSFGIVLNEVIAEEEPYSDQYRNFAGRGPFGAANYARLGKRPTINKSVTNRFVEDLIVQCWSPEPAKRPTFEKIQVAIRDALFEIPDTIQP